MNSSVAALPGCELDLAGERLWLLAERAVWWPGENTLLIADTHFGKEATFRASGIPVPDQTAEQLQRLDELLRRTQAQRLVVLGDLIHARRGRCETTFQQIADWRSRNSAVQLQLVRGNHDLRAGDPPANWGFECVDDPWRSGPFHLAHAPPFDHPGIPCALAGHLHPVVHLRGPGGDHARLPCFLYRNRVLTLPAFSHFIDGKVLSVIPHDQVFGICDDRVISLTTVARHGDQAGISHRKLL